jgi:glycosyltransferase involved in cell wall biosynthesis
MNVSVILCTANRSENLRGTLASLAAVTVPAGTTAELVVVDNGSADGTAELLASSRLPNMTVRAVAEPRRGLSHARNRGVSEAKGAALLFIDDDVRPDPGWLVGIADPILAGRAEAVAGAVALAPQLERAWMTARHRAWLAATDSLDFADPRNLIGANMAIARSVFDRIPRFDTELGAGALGFGEESLFVLELIDAGYRIVGAPQARVEHHFEASRLLRASWLDSARRRGQKAAFLAHHWHHEIHPDAGAQRWKAAARLAFGRARRPHDLRQREGCAEWELLLVRKAAFWKQFLVERARPAKYHRAARAPLAAAAG